MNKWSDVFSYVNGDLVWNIRASQRVKVGGIAGWEGGDGRISVEYKGVSYLAHRIIWELHYGEIPEGMVIDHINHNPKDNRIENLRLVSFAQNARNRKLPTNNTSGVIGVSWNKFRGKWRVQINANGKKKHVGLFDDLNDAILARKKANDEHGYHENHGL
ncbi:HNH endonuclease [Morganella morganii]|uniref:HNH endonuclease n=1 Tax=Morganella morganii TaxID=582 RepID=UPI0030FF01BA